MNPRMFPVLFVAAVGLFTACSTPPPQEPLIQGATRQSLDRATYVKEGMTQNEVLREMRGPPAVTLEKDIITEWHYCLTGRKSSAYAAYFFFEERVVGTSIYYATFEELGERGTCERFIRQGNFKEPGSLDTLREQVQLTRRREDEDRKMAAAMAAEAAEKKREREEVARQKAAFKVETYNIDLLRITTVTKKEPSLCKRGGIHELKLEGQIGPDSSFATGRLLDKMKPCTDSQGRIVHPVIVELLSGGGVLDDGYKLGEILRNNGATTYVPSDAVCASSCAVAFLGGSKRLINETGSILFHAPYFKGTNKYGERDINCEVGDETLTELNAYYVKMTDKDTGDRLFERTLWYCNASDGWVVTGPSAAELYGIATEK